MARVPVIIRWTSNAIYN